LREREALTQCEREALAVKKNFLACGTYIYTNFLAPPPSFPISIKICTELPWINTSGLAFYRIKFDVQGAEIFNFEKSYLTCILLLFYCSQDTEIL